MFTKKFSMHVAIILAGAFLLVGGYLSDCSAAQKVTTIRVGSTLVKEHPLSEAIYHLSAQVAQKTNGRIVIQYHPNSELGKAVEQLSGVRMGVQEMFFGANGRFSRIAKEFNLLSPSFTYKTAEDKLALLNSKFFAKLWVDLQTKYGLVVLNWDWLRGYRNLATKKPVVNLEELKGLKLRVPPSPAKIVVWKMLGASPTPTASSEQYMALKEGVIDGVEHNLFSIHGKHLDEIVKYVTMTKHEPIFCGFVVNGNFWNSLAPADRSIIQNAIKQAREWAAARSAKMNQEYINEMKTKEKVNFLELSPAERDRWFAIGAKAFQKLEDTKNWWPKGTVAKIMAKDPNYYNPVAK